MVTRREHTGYTKIVLILLWAGLVAGAVGYYYSVGVPLSEYPELIRAWVQGYGAWGGVVYVLIYLLRPLLFIPATLLTTVSGLVFGPGWGVFYTVIGENLSANFTFLIGKYFGQGLMDWMTARAPKMKQMECLFQDNGFLSVFIMRLSHFPFDFVGYLAGACSLRQVEFALGTFLGILPGLLTFVLLGASFTDPRNLALVALSLLCGLVLAHWIKRRRAGAPR